MCQLSWNLGASTSWNPQGLSRPVMGLLYLFIPHIKLRFLPRRQYSIFSLQESTTLCCYKNNHRFRYDSRGGREYIWNENQLMSLFYSYIAGSLHVSGPQAHLQESSYSCSHNHWFSICAALLACSVYCGLSWWLFSTVTKSPRQATTYREREQSGTDTEPMVVWTAVRTLLKMGLWARNM